MRYSVVQDLLLMRQKYVNCVAQKVKLKQKNHLVFPVILLIYQECVLICTVENELSMGTFPCCSGLVQDKPGICRSECTKEGEVSTNLVPCCKHLQPDTGGVCRLSCTEEGELSLGRRNCCYGATFGFFGTCNKCTEHNGTLDMRSNFETSATGGCCEGSVRLGNRCFNSNLCTFPNQTATTLKPCCTGAPNSEGICV